MDPRAVYAAIGEEPFHRLTAAFYRGVAGDPLLRPMYPGEDLEPARRRLALFLIQFFGGPPNYSLQRGHPRLRMRHLPFPIDQAARDAWMTHMRAALDGLGLPAEVHAAMLGSFEDASTFLINRAEAVRRYTVQTPEGLQRPSR
ncbi:MAG TPA: globin [Chloroflexota bacterium]|nr:globin [Chloroflexota bacterium]